VSKANRVDVDRTDTWTRYRKGLCTGCAARCCTMPVEVRVPDLLRLGMVEPFEAEHETPAAIARRLQRAGIVGHFSHKHAVFTLAQRAGGDCLYLDEHSRLCSVYEKRPETCRQHPAVGPRPGYCPYGPASDQASSVTLSRPGRAERGASRS
jgi:Fe-S-cluster containining protein